MQGEENIFVGDSAALHIGGVKGIEVVIEIKFEAAKGILPGVVILVKAIAEEVIDVEGRLSGIVRMQRDFVMEKIWLLREPGSGWIKSSDGLREGGIGRAGGIPDGFEATAEFDPGCERIGGIEAGEDIALAEEGLIGEVRIRADAVERHLREIACARVEMKDGFALFAERTRPGREGIVSETKLHFAHRELTYGGEAGDRNSSHPWVAVEFMHVLAAAARAAAGHDALDDEMRLVGE